MIYLRDPDGGYIISDACADCEESYIDDLDFEWSCHRKRCKYTKAEISNIIAREEAELKEYE